MISARSTARWMRGTGWLADRHAGFNSVWISNQSFDGVSLSVWYDSCLKPSMRSAAGSAANPAKPSTRLKSCSIPQPSAALPKCSTTVSSAICHTTGRRKCSPAWESTSIATLCYWTLLASDWLSIIYREIQYEHWRALYRKSASFHPAQKQTGQSHSLHHPLHHRGKLPPSGHQSQGNQGFQHLSGLKNAENGFESAKSG